MASITTITSRLYHVDADNTLQFIMTFTESQSGTNTNLLAEDEGITALDWGQLEWSYNIEDPLLVPSSYQATFTDMHGLLDAMLFLPQGVNYDKQFDIEIKLNGDTLYLGTAQEDGLQYSDSAKTLKVSFDAHTDILNKTQLYSTNTSGQTVANNPFNLDADTNYPFTQLLEKMYSLTGQNISFADGSLKVSHNWLLAGQRQNSSHFCNTIRLKETTQLAKPLFFEPEHGFQNVGDILKNLAMDWGCFTGLIHKKKAFFKKLFTFDAANTQSITDVIDHEHQYKYSTIDYVKVSSGWGGMYAGDYSIGTDTKLEGRTKELKTLPSFWELPPPDGYRTCIYANLARGDDDDGYYAVYQANDPVIDNVYGTSAETLGKFWYNWQHSISNLRTDTFTLNGLQYDFLKDFIYESSKFQPISMKMSLAQNRTEIEALYLGRL